MRSISVFITTVFLSLFALAQETPEFQPPPLLPEMRDGFGQTNEARAFRVLCPRVRINNDDIKFNGMETRLLCGDPERDQIGEPWRDIPPNEASFFIRGFLQTRGFHEPKFYQDGSILFVDTGPLSRLKSFRIVGGPSTWDPPKHRLIDDALLTPGLLNELQDWSISQIKNEGYACATAESRADPRRGEVVVFLAPGDFKYIKRIEDTGDSGLREGVLDRYNAFRIGDPYKERLIRLTQRRTANDDILQALVMREKCVPGPDLTIVRDVVLGSARSLRIALGASSEEGAKGRVVVRQSRIGESASSAEVRILGSYLRELVNHQSIQAKFRWYYSAVDAREFLEPDIIFDHTAEEDYETQDFETKLMVGLNREARSGNWEIRAGPGYLDSLQQRGPGPDRSSLLYAEFDARWLEHDFEWFNTSPRTGEVIDANILVTTEDWGSKFTAQKLQVAGQKLWMIGRFDPPLLILGMRFNVSTVFSPNSDITNELPVKFLTY